MKIVINACYGGFALTEAALKFMGLPVKYHLYSAKFRVLLQPHNMFDNEFRTNPKLVECVEKLGEQASDKLSKLVVVEIPDGFDFEIVDYDGMESVVIKGAEFLHCRFCETDNEVARTNCVNCGGTLKKGH